MKYYLGLDNGGTATKAAVFDENGREVAVAGMDTAMLVPKPGFTERDMEEMWEANCQVIRRGPGKGGCYRGRHRLRGGLRPRQRSVSVGQGRTSRPERHHFHR